MTDIIKSSDQDGHLTIPEPRANPDLTGHDEAVAALAGAAAGGRLHHAWLIAGPRGIGKATLAYRFARFLLAGSGEKPAPDAGDSLFGAEDLPQTVGGDTCPLAVDPENPVFHRVAASSHPDLLTVERSLNDAGTRLRNEIVIHDIRRVGEFLSLTAAEAGHRIVIIDGAEEMTRQAANALLKTLEEPPSGAVILLVSHAPGRLLPTVRSRCRKISLRPLERGTVVSLLARYDPEIRPEDAQLLASLAEGSIGRALSLANAGGVGLYAEMLDLLGTLPALDIARVHGVADALARSRAETGTREPFDVFAELLDWWVARLIQSRASGRPHASLIEGEGPIAARLSERGTLDQWLEVWEKTGHLLDRARRVNLDRKQVLLNIFNSFSRLAS